MIKAENDVMQAFWKSPLGQEWLKQIRKVYERMEKEPSKAVGILLPVDGKIKLERFED